MTDQRPKRRTCSSTCEAWTGGNTPAGYCFMDPFAIKIAGRDCTAPVDSLRIMAGVDPSGWEADELRARGLRA